MSDPAPTKPLPRPTELTRPFWEACRRHELVIQRCEACGDYRFFPAETCPRCGGAEYAWQRVEGRGEIYSWIVVHRPPDPAWAGDVPFVVAVVALDLPGRPLVTGTLVGCAAGAVTAGLRVEPEFEEVDGGVTLPRWRPSASSVSGTEEAR